MKKTIKITMGVLVCLVALTGCFGKKTNEEQLKEKLKEIGKSYYEDYYYVVIKKDEAEKKEVLQKYSDIGVHIDLDNLTRANEGKYKQDIEELFINSKTNETCDRSKTKVHFYPESPYEKGSYRMEIELVCGFEED